MSTEPEVFDSSDLGLYNSNFVPVGVMQKNSMMMRKKDRSRLVPMGEGVPGAVPGYGGGVLMQGRPPTSMAMGVPSGAVPSYGGSIPPQAQPGYDTFRLGGPGSVRRLPPNSQVVSGGARGGGVFDDILSGFSDGLKLVNQVSSVALPLLSMI